MGKLCLGIEKFIKKINFFILWIKVYFGENILFLDSSNSEHSEIDRGVFLYIYIYIYIYMYG